MVTVRMETGSCNCSTDSQYSDEPHTQSCKSAQRQKLI